MNRILRYKSAGTWLIACSCLLTIITVIAYSIFTAPYFLQNNRVILCLIVAAAAELILLLKDTSFDSYFLLASVVLSALAISLFIRDSVGTINDYINEVVFMGSGAPIEGIAAIGIMMFTVTVLNIISCFLSKTGK